MSFLETLQDFHAMSRKENREWISIYFDLYDEAHITVPTMLIMELFNT